MYEDVYAPLKDPAAYLERIGLDPSDYSRKLHPELPASPSDYSTAHTKESLDTLIKAHLLSVPFEDLDMYELGREVSLEIPALFEKIVVKKRGGFCFELNGLFYALLESLGFNCYSIACRILFEGPCPPLGHRAAIVTTENGDRLLCDVGFGGPAPVGALLLDSTQIQQSGKLRFRFSKREDGLYYHIYVMDDGSEMPLFLFSYKHFDRMDFVALSAYMSRGENARFHNERVLNILNEEGSIAIQDDELRIHKNGELTTKVLTNASERKEAYMTYFGMPSESLTELPE